MTSRLTPARSLASFALAGLCAITVAGCGNDIPPSAVAKVGDSTISKEEFERWYKNAAAGASQGEGAPAVAPDPPDFEKCVAGLQKQPAPQGAEQDLSQGRWLINPGAVGQPRDGDWRAAWLLLDLAAGTAAWRRVEYPIDEAARAIEDAGLPSVLSERLFVGQ